MSAINKWDSLSDNELIELVKLHRTIPKFCAVNGLPHYKTVLRRLNHSKWSELLDSLGLGKNRVGPKKESKDSLFYVLRCIDDDGTVFLKYGVTSGSIGSRYKAYADNYELLISKRGDLDTVGRLERFCDKLLEYKYIPKSINFQSSRHGGFSECLHQTAASLILSEII